MDYTNVAPIVVRDWAEDFELENGMYQNKCSVCGELFIGHKRRVICKECYDKKQTKTPEETYQERIQGQYRNKIKSILKQAGVKQANFTCEATVERYAEMIMEAVK